MYTMYYFLCLPVFGLIPPMRPRIVPLIEEMFRRARKS